MSEQTPEPSAEATDQDGYMSADPEPSMEDILASIRKIIADDADPVPLDGPDASASDTAIKPTLASNTVSTPTSDTLVAPDPSDRFGAKDSVASSDIEPLDGSLDIEAFLMDFDAIDSGPASDDLTIPVPEVEDETTIAPTPSAATETPVSTAVEDEDDDDMDRLMDELMSGLADDVVATPAATGPVSAAKPEPANAADDDIDLVKSLMADLTDEDLEAPIETVETAQAPSYGVEASDLPHDDLSDDVMDEIAEAESEELDDLDSLEEDIMDSLMDMALADDAPEAVKAADPSVPSLTDIAAAAEADAKPHPKPEPKPEPVAAKDATPAAAKADADDLQIPDIPQTDTQPMETPMPRAVRSDAILDDVTEEATMSAFAQLNQVVEDKAILSERGPRVGDLVQEALKPMLKEWLDENLQGIVERAVAKEVKRIASGK